jgi:hypothetical protein
MRYTVKKSMKMGSRFLILRGDLLLLMVMDRSMKRINMVLKMIYMGMKTVISMTVMFL